MEYEDYPDSGYGGYNDRPDGSELQRRDCDDQPTPLKYRGRMKFLITGGIVLFLLIALFALFSTSPKKDNSTPANTATIIGKWKLSDSAMVNFVKNGVVFRDPPPGKSSFDRAFENKSGRWDVYEDILTINWDGVIFKGRDVYKINKLAADQLELEHLQNGTVLTGARVQ